MMRFAMALVALTSLAGCAQYDATRNANLEAAGRDQVAVDDANEHASGTRGYQRMLDGMTNDSALKPFSRGD
jgi:hypothetical protein